MDSRHVLTDEGKISAATVEGQVIVFTIKRDLIVLSAALTFGVIFTTNIVAKNAELDGCATRSDYCLLSTVDCKL